MENCKQELGCHSNEILRLTPPFPFWGFILLLAPLLLLFPKFPLLLPKNEDKNPAMKLPESNGFCGPISPSPCGV